MARIRPLGPRDLGWKEETLIRAWGGTRVARKGEMLDALELDGFVALEGIDPVGLLTYVMHRDDFEVVTVHVDHESRGFGRALMDAARLKAEELGARRMWLTTTNDNLRAYGFYQQWGMDLAALHRNGVARSREMKPSIPLYGTEGIPIRHELEFELPLLATRS